MILISLQAYKYPCLFSQEMLKSWGENGYFRILRGVNESDIEKLIIAAWGQLTSADEP